jgi:ribonuclease Z
MPTPERNSSSIAIRLGRNVILLDCGEGTQRQMIAAHIGFSRVKSIFITHLHGDHVLGCPGLLQSMTLQHREEPLDIYGPKGTHSLLQGVSESLGGPGFPVSVHEISEPGVLLNARGFLVECCRADHRLEAWSYAVVEKPRPGRFHPEKAKFLGVPEGIMWKRLQHGEDLEVEGRMIRSSDVTDPSRPGRKLVYSGDTRPNDELTNLAKGADLLIHEATFSDDLLERAQEDGHSTVSQAAANAMKAGVKKLILTHISSRYGDTSFLLEAAKKIFSETEIAQDLFEVDVLVS